MAACIHVSSKLLCCETVKETDTSLVSNFSEPETTTTTTALPVHSNLQEPPLTAHKNYKLFDNRKCGIPYPVDRVAFGT